MSKEPIASFNTPEYDALVELIKDLRAEKRISQRKLSALLGRAESFVQKIEDKDRRLDVIEFLQLAKVLELDPAELINRLTRRIGGTKE